MTLEQHIEELRAELRNCPVLEERQEIKAELANTLSELAEIETALEAALAEEAPS